MRRLFILTVVALVVAVGAPVAASADTGQHAAITITSDSDFTAPGSPTGCACVTAGIGTNSPVIGPWAISAPTGDSTGGWAVKVVNTIVNGVPSITKSFTISGISANYSGVGPTDRVIWLVGVNSATISNASANENGIGVELDGSSNITLDQLSFNKMNGTGLYINGLNSDGSCSVDKGSSNIWLSNSKFKSTADNADETKHYADGVYADCANNLHLGGVAACPASQICNSFDYDSGFGVYLQNTTNSFIDRASANADDTAGYVLDNSSGVILSNSGAGSDGPICFSLGGPMNKTHTGYESDLQGNLHLINNSSGNTFSNDQFAAPIGGPSIASGGNGFFFDPCSKSDTPFTPTTPEGPVGSGNTFPNTCYASNDIGLPPAPCK
jgi:hypothetical protein